MPNLISQKRIEQKIMFIRRHEVMLDKDLAELYGVTTKRLNEQVRRNIKRFPEDFMHILTEEEKRYVVANCDHLKSLKYSPYLPYAFTEQGVAMLSSVLNSERAIQINIAIMRVFVKFKKLLSIRKKLNSRGITTKLNQIDKKMDKQGKDTKIIMSYISTPQTKLISPKKPFTNKKIFWDIIKSCEKHIYWIDKYFSVVGLELLSQSLEKKKVRKIKILMSVDKANEKFRNVFKDFKREMRNRGISCELRVITNNKVKSAIHDRWIISSNRCFNIPSTDTLARGQYSEVKETINKPPFNKWWKNSKNILTEWKEILINKKER